MSEHDQEENRRALEDARRFINENLPEIAREMLAWKDTGVLEHGKVRTVARMVAFVGNDRLAVATAIIHEEALESVVATANNKRAQLAHEATRHMRNMK